MSVLFLSTNLESLPLWMLFVLCAWLGFFGIGWYSLFIVEVAEKAADDSVGVTVSFALTLNQIAIITAPPVFGLIVDMRGYAFSWLCLAFSLLLSGLWLYKMKDF
jgi:predicted MFS family arabinose efflux permease